MSSWYTYTDQYSEAGDYPHGIVTNYSNHKHLSGDGTDEENWAVRMTAGMIPGINEWGTGWINDATWAVHDWDYCELPSYNMLDWDPNGGHEGTQSYGVSLSKAGPSISWTYSQPNVTRHDYTSTNEYHLAWGYSDASNDDSINYDVGSQTQTGYPTSPGTYAVCYPWVKGRFYDGQWWDVDKASYYATNWFEAYY